MPVVRENAEDEAEGHPGHDVGAQGQPPVLGPPDIENGVVGEERDQEHRDVIGVPEPAFGGEDVVPGPEAQLAQKDQKQQREAGPEDARADLAVDDAQPDGVAPEDHHHGVGDDDEPVLEAEHDRVFAAPRSPEHRREDQNGRDGKDTDHEPYPFVPHCPCPPSRRFSFIGFLPLYQILPGLSTGSRVFRATGSPKRKRGGGNLLPQPLRQACKPGSVRVIARLPSICDGCCQPPLSRLRGSVGQTGERKVPPSPQRRRCIG